MINLDNPSIAKVLKIIELTLLNSKPIALPIKVLIDQINSLKLLDEIYYELIDIINAGISAGYKFKIRSDPMSKYLIQLDVD